MIFAVDYDGTIRDGTDDDKAVEVLKALQDRGHKIILWTCREGAFLEEALSALRDQGFFPDAVNANITGIVGEKLYGLAEHKVLADYYFDDRSFPPFSGWQSAHDTFIKPWPCLKPQRRKNEQT